MRPRFPIVASVLLGLVLAVSAAPGQEIARAAGGSSITVLHDESARLELAGSVLELDSGSVGGSTRIEVTQLDDGAVPPLDHGMTNVTRGARGFRYGPHGSTFDRELRLTLPYDPRLLPPGMTEHDVHAYYYDEASGRWVAFDRLAIDPASQTVISVTDHFTDVIAATLEQPTQPDVASHAPTMLLDMQAADPGRGIQLIQPPQPSPMGDARLSYTIDLPPGRNGMQPQLELTYKSEGANTWLGVGWDLAVQDVMVDTRWGVPRFGMLPNENRDVVYQDRETESYLLNGTALTPVAHRSEPEERTGNLKVFHERVEGNFSQILRHGDHPSNFWWEVVDRYGTRTLYGDVPGYGGTATLRDDGGNVFRWMVREIRDANGNAMRFEYDVVSAEGIPGGASGREIYLRAINYTGTASGTATYQPGAYSVRFIRESELNPGARRPDVRIDYRGGFRQVAADLLRRVRIEMDGALVREYGLEYETGTFEKIRLRRLTVRGANGELFAGNEHRFSYYDDVTNGTGTYAQAFEPDRNWSMPLDDISLCSDLGPLDVCPSSFAIDFHRASGMSGAITHGIGGHLYLGLNCGLSSKYLSGGAKVGFGVTQTNMHLGLFDVNGDNLPDKVFKSGASVMYRANESRPGGVRGFSSVARPLGDLDAISVETATTASGGVELYYGGSVLVNAATTFVVGTTYTTDANGDGLADVVRNGTIMYGVLDDDGALRYESTSANTPLPLAPGRLDGAGLIQDYEPLFQDLLDQYHLLDTFRRWTAPFDGAIRISGGVRVDEPDETADGVRASVQHNGSVLWSTRIPRGDPIEHPLTGLDRIQVEKGDRIYFRLQSVFDGSMDAVSWDPSISYLDVDPEPDANGRNQYRYRASEDFVLVGRQATARMPTTGDVRLTGTLFKNGRTSDDVTLQVLRNGSSIMSVSVPWDSAGDIALDYRFSVSGDDTSTADVDEADQIQIYLRVDSPIDAALVGWRKDAPPELVYESTPELALRALGDEPEVRLFVPSNMDLYPQTNRSSPQTGWVSGSDEAFSVRTALGGEWEFQKPTDEEPLDDGRIVFTVKQGGRLLAKRVLEVENGRVDNATVRVEGADEDEPIFFTYSGRDLSKFGTVDAEVDQTNVPVAVYTNIRFDDVPRLGRGLFAQPYRGWAYAAYNGNPSRDSPERPHACTGTRGASTAPIREADLVLAEDLGDVDEDTPPEELESRLSDKKAYVLSPVYERLPEGPLRATWRGLEKEGWVDAARMSASRIALSFVGVPCPGDVESPDPTADARAVPRIGTGVSAGAGAGFIIAVSAAVGSSANQLDFLDLNGDQFPDVIGNGRAHYTMPNGGLEEKSRSLASWSAVRRSTNTAGSISLGGSVPINIGGSRGTTAANTKSAPRGERSENSMPSFGFGGDLTFAHSQTEADLIDINGDGLPDRVREDGMVELNTGYGFAPEEAWPGLGVFDEADAFEFTLSGGLGFNDLIYGYAGGLSYSRVEQHTKRSFADLNSDGLIDRVRVEDDALWVALNTGTGFADETRWGGTTVSDIAMSASSSLGAGAYVTIPVPIFMCTPVTVLFLIINPGASVTGAMARQEAALMDMDGDGAADFVQSSRDDELIVSSNKTGRTNLLRQVERPLGGSFVLDYRRDGNSPDLPQASWTLASIELRDGVAGDGPSSLLTTIAYENPQFGRGEREFMGFGTVREEHRSADAPEAVLRSVVREYVNDNYYGKGLIKSELTLDAEGRPLRGMRQEYAYRDVATGVQVVAPQSRTATVFPMVTSTTTQTFDADGGVASSRREFEYDEHGNVSYVLDYGDEGPEDDIEAVITYSDCVESGISGRPTGIRVTSNGRLMAERRATLDCASGSMLQIRRYLEDGTYAATDMTYDAAGMTRSVTGPPNLSGQRYSRTFDYDGRTGTHVTRVTDSHGLTSSTSYDLRFGLPTSVVDASGQEVSYAYDDFARAVSVTGPYERGLGTPTIRFEYGVDQPLPWARTRHYDPSRGPDDPLDTVLFVDGLQRVIQTKVDATVHGAPGEPPRDAMVVSGRQRFDALGRVAEQFQPTVESLGHGTAFNASFHSVEPSRIEHDALDRPTSLTLPDETVTRYRYGLARGRSGKQRHETRVVDARNNTRIVRRDPRDLIVGESDGGGLGADVTYVYDGMDRLASIVDEDGNETRMEYDALGRRTAIVQPDAGTTRFEYDLAGNLVARRTARLAGGEPVRYEYDQQRLTAVRYPEHPENDVTYEYGTSGNDAGRVIRVTDGVGVEELEYGKLGEVIRQTRTVTGFQGNSPHATRSFTTRFEYDTWGRLLNIEYPDGEVVTYTYDAGGMVSRVVGRDQTRTTEYVRAIEYDAFRQQTYIELGNGVRSWLAYRPEDQRLASLRSVGPEGEFQNLRYEYDAVGNVTSIRNDVEPVRPPDFGGPVVQEFEYDDLYRLSRATGTFQAGQGKVDGYSLEFRYDRLHNIEQKTQSHYVIQPSGQRVEKREHSYSQSYEYDASHPHAPSRVGDRTFSYDASGNQTGWTHDRSGRRRTIEWDEENRPASIANQGHTMRYRYDAAGHRILKRGPGGEVAFVNQFFNLRNGTIGTKHIYVGPIRIASMISKQPGGGGSGRPATSARDIFYYHADHLTSTQFVSDENGILRQHLQYFPSGEPWIEQRMGPQVTDLEFSGHEFDEETGLYYYGARYKDPQTGQFLSVDPASVAGDDDPTMRTAPALNVYSYAFNNPVRMVDPDGRFPSVWSAIRNTAAYFRGASGRSFTNPTTTTSTNIVGGTDSPVRAAAASNADPALAAGGAGVTGSLSQPSARISARREFRSAVSRGAFSIRGPPTYKLLQPDKGRNRPPIVLGENMVSRVTPYAKSIGGETIVDWLAGREWTQQLNDDFIASIKSEGRQVIDIGPDFARRLRFHLNPPADRGGRPVYETERQALRGYSNYKSIFTRTGKFEGGVAGLDYPGSDEGGVAGMKP